MSKKQKSKQVQKQETQIVEQQKEPCLRALQKKVRNINKKLNQISELEKKKDLKPEQEEKISRKDQLLEEREKYNEFIGIYQDIVADNEKAIRQTQLIELQDLATLIAVKEYGAEHISKSEKQHIDNLVKTLTKPLTSNLTVKQRVDEISKVFLDAANNRKLKQSANEFVRTNPDKKLNLEAISHQPEPLSPKSQEEREKQLEELDEEEKKWENAIPTPEIEEVKPKQEDPKPEEVKKVSVEPSPVNATSPEENKAEVNNTNQPKADEVTDKKEETKPVRGSDQNRRYRGKGHHGRGERNDRQNQNKKTFKPKYEEKATGAKAKNEQSSSSSSLEKTPEAREFKKEEVRELIEDGFIVVGKPKIKSKEQKEYYDHEHGKKHHHHHSKKNN